MIKQIKALCIGNTLDLDLEPAAGREYLRAVLPKSHDGIRPFFSPGLRFLVIVPMMFLCWW
jgi:hypothetical protein